MEDLPSCDSIDRKYLHCLFHILFFRLDFFSISFSPITRPGSQSWSISLSLIALIPFCLISCFEDFPEFLSRFWPTILSVFESIRPVIGLSDYLASCLVEPPAYRICSPGYRWNCKRCTSWSVRLSNEFPSAEPSALPHKWEVKQTQFFSFGQSILSSLKHLKF